MTGDFLFGDVRHFVAEIKELSGKAKTNGKQSGTVRLSSLNQPE